jgi:nicotinamidase/pyrazinamidase
MKQALIIVDMLKDTFDKHPDAFITKEALKFILTINRLSAMFKYKGFPVIFSCDSFLQSDFIFQGKMKPLQKVSDKTLEAISKMSFGPISVLGLRFNSSEYLSMPAG